MKRIDADRVRHLIEIEKTTQEDVAKILGVSRRGIQNCCYRNNIQTQRTGPRSGDQHPDWRGGVTMRKGYRYIYAPDHPHAINGRYVAEHRLVVEQAIGRYLEPGEAVHHINQDQLDNRLENLQLFSSNADHLRHELTGKTPNHTPEGKLRMRESILRSHSLGKLKPDGCRRTQTNHRSKGKRGSKALAAS